MNREELIDKKIALAVSEGTAPYAHVQAISTRVAPQIVRDFASRIEAQVLTIKERRFYAHLGECEECRDVFSIALERYLRA